MFSELASVLGSALSMGHLRAFYPLLKVIGTYLSTGVKPQGKLTNSDGLERAKVVRPQFTRLHSDLLTDLGVIKLRARSEWQQASPIWASPLSRGCCLHAEYVRIKSGGVGEWLKPAVLTMFLLCCPACRHRCACCGNAEPFGGFMAAGRLGVGRKVYVAIDCSSRSGIRGSVET